MIGGGHVIVTGGVGALGLAIAERLLDDGCSVTVLDADAAGVAACTERFAGEDVLFFECDVSDEDQVTEVFAEAVAEMGPVTGLVNCAGIEHRAAFEHTSTELFRQIVEVNLTGVFITSKAALDEMGDGLSIVNMSAPAAIDPGTGEAAYAAAKSGLHGLGRGMAKEFAGGVRVNTVVPMKASDTGNEAPGDFAEVAATVLFLLSGEASGISGQVLSVGDASG